MPDLNREAQRALAAALERRAAAHEGAVREGLQQRARAARAAAEVAEPKGPAAPAVGTALAGLSALVDRLGRPQGQGRQPLAGVLSSPPAAPLKAVAAFQGTWSRLRAEQRLRQALAQVPAKAGPLNSSQVVHRALQALHELSPAYLDAFMHHVDTLLWLEQASGGDLPLRAPKARRISR